MAWLELVRDLDSARISTIHSFCALLLRAHAVEAGLDPRFRVLDGAQAGTLLFELTDELRERLADRDEADAGAGREFGLDRLREMIARLLAHAAGDRLGAVARSETPEGLVARWEEFWRDDTCRAPCGRSAESPAAQRCSISSAPLSPVTR